MAPPRKCAVPNCTGKNSRRFRIPIKNEAAKNVWLQRIACESLQKYSDGELSNRVFLCGGHFREECLGKLLSRGSLPTINMPGFHEEPTLQNSFIQTREVEVRIPIPIDQEPAMNAQSIICETTSGLPYEPKQKEFKGRSLSLGRVQRCTIQHLSSEGPELYKFVSIYKKKLAVPQRKYKTTKQNLQKAANSLTSQVFEKMERSSPDIADSQCVLHFLDVPDFA